MPAGYWCVYFAMRSVADGGGCISTSSRTAPVASKTFVKGVVARDAAADIRPERNDASTALGRCDRDHPVVPEHDVLRAVLENVRPPDVRVVRRSGGRHVRLAHDRVR